MLRVPAATKNGSVRFGPTKIVAGPSVSSIEAVSSKWSCTSPSETVTGTSAPDSNVGPDTEQVSASAATAWSKAADPGGLDTTWSNTMTPSRSATTRVSKPSTFGRSTRVKVVFSVNETVDVMLVV